MRAGGRAYKAVGVTMAEAGVAAILPSQGSRGRTDHLTSKCPPVFSYALLSAFQLLLLIHSHF